MSCNKPIAEGQDIWYVNAGVVGGVEGINEEGFIWHEEKQKANDASVHKPCNS